LRHPPGMIFGKFWTILRKETLPLLAGYGKIYLKVSNYSPAFPIWSATFWQQFEDFRDRWLRRCYRGQRPEIEIIRVIHSKRYVEGLLKETLH
jgi:hypothetical protein